MAWAKAKTTVTASIAVLLLAGAAVAVKLIWFPPVKDAYFLLNDNKLRQVPANLVVVRPTHFSKTRGNGIMVISAQVDGNSVRRMMGRNVTFQEMMAMAYGRSLSRVALPVNPPKDHYDFLVTVPANPEGRLQTAIRRKLGYTAQVETQDTAVLALKVQNPNSSGLRVSTATSENQEEKNGRLYFTHMRLGFVTDHLEEILKTPVVDKTGLTDYYDFSLVWDSQTQQAILNGTLDRETGQKILAEWGLGLEPDTAPIEMLVVKKVY